MLLSRFAVAQVSEESSRRIAAHLRAYNFESLTAYMYMVDALKSLILSMALVSGRIDVDQAVQLALLEQE